MFAKKPSEVPNFQSESNLSHSAESTRVKLSFYKLSKSRNQRNRIRFGMVFFWQVNTTLVIRSNDSSTLNSLEPVTSPRRHLPNTQCSVLSIQSCVLKYSQPSTYEKIPVWCHTYGYFLQLTQYCIGTLNMVKSFTASQRGRRTAQTVCEADGHFIYWRLMKRKLEKVSTPPFAIMRVNAGLCHLQDTVHLYLLKRTTTWCAPSYCTHSHSKK